MCLNDSNTHTCTCTCTNKRISRDVDGSKIFVANWLLLSHTAVTDVNVGARGVKLGSVPDATSFRQALFKCDGPLSFSVTFSPVLVWYTRHYAAAAPGHAMTNT